MDSRLTFANHVDAAVSKANRLLGLLIRSIQVSSRTCGLRFDHAAALAAYKAHVRSVMEYGSVIWSGAALTHLRRLERVQHRFLAWLASKTQERHPQPNYQTLMSLYGCPSVKSRLIQTDLMFIRSVFSGNVDCVDIVKMFPLSAPARRSRHPELFHVPRGSGRVNAVKMFFFLFDCHKL